MKKTFAFLFILLLLCPVLISCVEDPDRPDFDVVSSGKSEYSVVYSQTAPRSVRLAAEDFASLLKEKTGAELPVVSDDREEGEKEILFGETNRRASSLAGEGLELSDYRIAVFDRKIAISSPDKDSLAAAAYYLVKEYANEDGLTLDKDFSYTWLVPVRKYKMSEVADKIKVMGRSSFYGDSISADWSACGIEFAAKCKGDVKLTVTVLAVSSYEAASYFTVYIDGVRQEERLLALSGTHELTLASGLEEGEHSFRFFKQAHNVHCSVNIDAVALEGFLSERPADRDLYIEYIGDSITAGYGVYAAEGKTQQTYPYSDGTQSYAFFASEELNADYSLLARCSWGILAAEPGKNLPDVYRYICYSRNNDPYDFSSARVPDIVVINLGTNDYSKGMCNNEFKEKTVAFVKDIRADYGKDVPVVILYGMMNNTGYVYLRKAAQELGGEAAGVYTLEMPLSRSGGGNHPSIGEQKNCGGLLSEFIRRTFPDLVK